VNDGRAGARAGANRVATSKIRSYIVTIEGMPGA
jgi:hypothetical protein